MINIISHRAYEQEDLEMTRAEHMAFCKQRALEYIEHGDVKNAITSMFSDLGKHTETKDIVKGPLLQLGMMYTMNHDIPGARRFIEGFN